MRGKNWCVRMWGAFCLLLLLGAPVVLAQEEGAIALAPSLLSADAGTPSHPCNFKISFPLPGVLRHGGLPDLNADNFRVFVAGGDATREAALTAENRAQGLMLWRYEDTVFLDVRKPPQKSAPGEYAVWVQCVESGAVLAEGCAAGLVRYAPGTVDVVLVIDQSQSMRRTDPHKRRVAAAGAFVEYAARHGRISHIGIVAFNRRADVLAGLTDVSERATLLAALHKVGAESQTNMDRALLAAEDVLFRSTAGRQAVVFLTDGNNDPLVYQDTHQRFGERGVPVFTIGLSDKADHALLERMAQETGGQAFRAGRDKDLMSIYQRIAAAIGRGVLVYGERLPVRGNSAREAFPVDSSLRSLSILVDHDGAGGGLVVVPPDGKEVDATNEFVAFLRNDGYQMARVLSPAAGAWEAGLRQNASADALLSVMGESDLFLDLFPAQFDGRTLTLGATLACGAAVISGSTVTVQLPDYATVSSVQMFDDGRHGDGKAGDGVYSGMVVLPSQAEGTIALLMRARGHAASGEPFVRQAEVRLEGVRREDVVRTPTVRVDTRLSAGELDLGFLVPGTEASASASLVLLADAPEKAEVLVEDLAGPDGERIPLLKTDVSLKSGQMLSPGKTDVDVRLVLPGKVPPGVYRGAVVVKAGSAQTRIPVLVDVPLVALGVDEATLPLGEVDAGKTVRKVLVVGLDAPHRLPFTAEIHGQAASWVRLANKTDILEVGPENRLPFRVEVPRQADAGDYGATITLRCGGTESQIGLRLAVTMPVVAHIHKTAEPADDPHDSAHTANADARTPAPTALPSVPDVPLPVVSDATAESPSAPAPLLLSGDDQVKTPAAEVNDSDDSGASGGTDVAAITDPWQNREQTQPQETPPAVQDMLRARLVDTPSEMPSELEAPTPGICSRMLEQLPPYLLWGVLLAVVVLVGLILLVRSTVRHKMLRFALLSLLLHALVAVILAPFLMVLAMDPKPVKPRRMVARLVGTQKGQGRAVVRMQQAFVQDVKPLAVRETRVQMEMRDITPAPMARKTDSLPVVRAHVELMQKTVQRKQEMPETRFSPLKRELRNAPRRVKHTPVRHSQPKVASVTTEQASVSSSALPEKKETHFRAMPLPSQTAATPLARSSMRMPSPSVTVNDMQPSLRAESRPVAWRHARAGKKATQTPVSSLPEHTPSIVSAPIQKKQEVSRVSRAIAQVERLDASLQRPLADTVVQKKDIEVANTQVTQLPPSLQVQAEHSMQAGAWGPSVRQASMPVRQIPSPRSPACVINQPPSPAVAHARPAAHAPRKETVFDLTAMAAPAMSTALQNHLEKPIAHIRSESGDVAASIIDAPERLPLTMQRNAASKTLRIGSSLPASWRRSLPPQRDRFLPQVETLVKQVTSQVMDAPAEQLPAPSQEASMRMTDLLSSDCPLAVRVEKRASAPAPRASMSPLETVSLRFARTTKPMLSKQDEIDVEHARRRRAPQRQVRPQALALNASENKPQATGMSVSVVAREAKLAAALPQPVLDTPQRRSVVPGVVAEVKLPESSHALPRGAWQRERSTQAVWGAVRANHVPRGVCAPARDIAPAIASFSSSSSVTEEDGFDASAVGEEKRFLQPWGGANSADAHAGKALLPGGMSGQRAIAQTLGGATSLRVPRADVFAKWSVGENHSSAATTHGGETTTAAGKLSLVVGEYAARSGSTGAPLASLLAEVRRQKEERLLIQRREVTLSARDLADCYVLVIRGDAPLRLQDEERTALLDYLEQGGCLWIDNTASPSNNAFVSSVQREILSPMQARHAGAFNAADNSTAAQRRGELYTLQKRPVISLTASRVNDPLELNKDVALARQQQLARFSLDYLMEMENSDTETVPVVSRESTTGKVRPWKTFDGMSREFLGWTAEKWGNPVTISLAPDGAGGDALRLDLQPGNRDKTAIGYTIPVAEGRRIDLRGVHGMYMDIYSGATSLLQVSLVLTVYAGEKGWQVYETRPVSLQPGWNRKLMLQIGGTELRSRATGWNRYDSRLENAENVAKIGVFLYGKTNTQTTLLLDNLVLNFEKQ